jgi:hypothetical protein
MRIQKVLAADWKTAARSNGALSESNGPLSARKKEGQRATAVSKVRLK